MKKNLLTAALALVFAAATAVSSFAFDEYNVWPGVAPGEKADAKKLLKIGNRKRKRPTLASSFARAAPTTDSLTVTKETKSRNSLRAKELRSSF